ncbi:MAG: RNA pseudouridine synthase [Desulfovibrio sp.]|nr:RNA pseudouridine synthase [Desulfovibrio sp.]
MPDFADLFPLRWVRPLGAPDLRLDAALGEALPGYSLRARRRLWAVCRVSVNGRAREAGRLTRAGDILEVERLRPVPDSAPAPGAIRTVAWNADYIVFDKASGLHSAHISGSPEMSLESLARGMLPATEARALRFLTRLDRTTSGLVLAALNARAVERFRLAERVGLTWKSYLAVVQGRLSTPLLTDNKLRTRHRPAKPKAAASLLPDNGPRAGKGVAVSVLREKEPDATRHCRVLPLPQCAAVGAVGGVEGGEVTLVRVDIMRGVRHQVRACLAAAGFPLYGDKLYGGDTGPLREGPEFYLHHARLESQEIRAQSMPAWVGLFAAPEEAEALLLMPMPERLQS